MKHLFIIPGWYPHLPCFPFEGSYVREQAEAIAGLHPDLGVTLSLWDQGRGDVSVGHLLMSPGCVLGPLRSNPAETPLAANLVAMRSPARSWHPGILGGNRNAILAANRINLERASARLGRPDVLHAHVSYPAGWVAMRLSREFSIPYVVTEHMGPFPLPYYATRDGSLSPLLREPLANADAIVAVSPALADRIASLDLPRPRFIPNLVDERSFRVGPVRGGAPFTFLTVGAMQEAKGIRDLIEAASRLRPRMPPAQWENLRFRIVGDGPQRAEFRSEARRLGLDSSIAWVDPMARDRLVEEFQSCDCYVLPSHHESFGIVLVEALACGRPLIATRCGGPEAIVNAANGLLVESRDPEALSRALEAMLKRAREYEPQRLRAEFMARFSRTAVVDALDSVYRDAMARARAGTSRAV